MATPSDGQSLDGIRLYPLAEQVSRALDGAVFPLTRAQLLRVALENEAPTTLVTLFYGLPNRVFRTLDGVQRDLEERALARAATPPVSG